MPAKNKPSKQGFLGTANIRADPFTSCHNTCWRFLNWYCFLKVELVKRILVFIFETAQRQVAW
jgi:hypothetical protein